MTFFEDYDVVLAVLGIAFLATALLPNLLEKRPVSLPMILLATGFVAFALPLGIRDPDPAANNSVTLHLAELGVIVSLMGAGLKIDRPFGLRSWRTTWALLAITMPLTILATAVLGWWAVGLAPAAAVLLGAVIAPTDPVLASEIQVGAPGEGYEETTKEQGPTGEEEDEVRFALTSEAGLNDGLAFPFTYAAIFIATSGAIIGEWVWGWLTVEVAYKIALGLLLGFLSGRLAARTILATPAKTEIARAITGVSAVAATLLVYGLTESLSGYGFVAVFVAAFTMRNYERDHDYHGSLHVFTEQAELILTAGIVIALGGAVAGGILAPLTFEAVLVGLAVIFLVRPIAGMVGLSLARKRLPLRERAAMSFFGIRGIGSVFYLAYAFSETGFPQEDLLWAMTAFVIITSIVVHGVTGVPVMNYLDRKRAKEATR